VINAPTPLSSEAMRAPTVLSAAPGAMPPAPPLRPYLGLLACFGAEELKAALPSDASPLLFRLLRAATPLRSLHELHVETGIAMPMIFKLALHLQRWHKMRLVLPLNDETLFCVHPDASLSLSSVAARDFAAAFAPRPPLSYARALALFSSPQRFGELLRAQQLPARKLVQVTLFLWRRQLLQQLQTCIYCISSPPQPVGDDDQAQVRWRLFQQIRPMLYGEHAVEEISWLEGIDRTVLNELLHEYAAHVVCTVTPALSYPFVTTQ